MTQLIFDWPHRAALGQADFFATGSNAEAVQWIERWPDWPAPAVLLCGPAGCGKTHLLHLWRERAGAALVAGGALDAAALPPAAGESGRPVAVDDADQAPERALLHLHNSCLAHGGRLLLSARHHPADWAIALPDLRSRLRACLAVAIAAPDDALLAAVLVKHFADRQLQVRPEVVLYLVAHMERSFAAAAALVARLDAAALEAGLGVTLALTRRVMAAAPDQSSAADPGAA